VSDPWGFWVSDPWWSTYPIHGGLCIRSMVVYVSDPWWSTYPIHGGLRIRSMVVWEKKGNFEKIGKPLDKKTKI